MIPAVNCKTENTSVKIEKSIVHIDYAFRVQSQMWIAENDLVDALTEDQQELYRDYNEKREYFFKIAKEMYKRKI